MVKTVQNVKICGGFMLVFILLAGVMAALSLIKNIPETSSPHNGDLINGKWTSRFEKAFDKALPIRDRSLTFWGLTDFMLFQEGRKGVIIGKDGWLFTKEEFDFFPNREESIKNKIAYIQSVRDIFLKHHIQLVVALIPAKARIYQNKLKNHGYPSYWQPVYEDVRTALHNTGVTTPDLLTPLATKAKTNDVFLKTDTHWNHVGADLTAHILAGHLRMPHLPRTNFQMKKENNFAHEGDLLRYVPLGKYKEQLGVSSDSLVEIKIDSAAQPASSLFDDVVIPVALVGTSYSANPLWGFEKFLKTALQSDVLNAADEGKGPFATMENYLENATYKNNGTQLVIWEIPERYLPVPYDFSNKKK